MKLLKLIIPPFTQHIIMPSFEYTKKNQKQKNINIVPVFKESTAEIHFYLLI